MAVKLDYDDKIAIIRLGDDENRFLPSIFG